MTARDLMTLNPACCTTDTPLQDVAKAMVDYDCGEIPIVEDKDTLTPVGVVTDRDIVCRTVAQGKNPILLTAADVMTSPAITVRDNDSDEVVKHKMEMHQIRRLPVVDRNGCVCGLVALADIARGESRKAAGEVIREVSAPSRA